MVLNVILFGVAGFAGLLLVLTLNPLMNMIFNYISLVRLNSDFKKVVFDINLGKIFIISALTSLLCWVLLNLISGDCGNPWICRPVTQIFILLFLGVSFYVALCYLFRVEEMHELIRIGTQLRRGSEIGITSQDAVRNR
jgi:peptidoglycan biosynthesis protein MviN/MurJ (putative lipid II flippase)